MHWELPVGGQHSRLSARDLGSEIHNQCVSSSAENSTNHLKENKQKDQPQRLGVEGIQK